MQHFNKLKMRIAQHDFVCHVILTYYMLVQLTKGKPEINFWSLDFFRKIIRIEISNQIYRNNKENQN